jgi:lysozyme family protein
MASFAPAYNLTVAGHEGGYRNVAWDAETYRGINRNVWPNWSGWAYIDSRKPVAYNKVFTELEPAVMDFYRQLYWNTMKGDYISNQSLANLIFDYLVQTGNYAIDKVQQAINSVIPSDIEVDGVIGQQTLNALNSAFAGRIYNAIIEFRKQHYQNLLQAGIISPIDWNGVWQRITSFPGFVANNKKAFAGILLTGAALATTIYLVRNRRAAA